MLTYRLPQVLRIFHRRFPHVELIFRPQYDEAIPALLESGKMDMAVCMIEPAPTRPSSPSLCAPNESFSSLIPAIHSPPAAPSSPPISPASRFCSLNPDAVTGSSSTGRWPCKTFAPAT
jgi:DNA-binding transcriptional LysR family regulator